MVRATSCSLAALLAVFSFGGCASAVRTNPNVADAPVHVDQTFDHSILDMLLHKHVSDSGLVDYQGLAANRSVLVTYLEGLALIDPNMLSTERERKAYWLNAYNATALFGVLRFGPTSPADDAVNFGALLSTRCGGHWWTLEQMRDGSLRPLHDPRLLMAICDSSRGGPRLRREAYVAAKIEEQLDSAARDFLSDPLRNQIDDLRRIARLSPLFERYASDFSVPPYFGVRGFVRLYTLPRDWLQSEFAIESATYDRRLNTQGVRK